MGYKHYLLTCFFISLFASLAQACRYNIRDVGFVDLGRNNYYLFGFVDSNTSEKFRLAFEKVTAAALPDSNVTAALIDVDKDTRHPALEYYRKANLNTYPAAVLISPRGKTKVISLSSPDKPLDKFIASAVDGIILSPIREQVLPRLLEVYAAVLLFETENDAENNAARAMTRAALEELRRAMEFLPKEVKNPPIMLSIPPESVAREEILLWSLDLDKEKLKTPCAVVLFGRGQQVGPVLAGLDLKQKYIFNVLSVVGADCECDLDRRWMQGIKVPHRWDKKLQSRVVKVLGFDPASPMVKTEINRIVGRGIIFQDPELNLLSQNIPPLGYQEIVIEFDEPSQPNLPTEENDNTHTDNSPADAVIPNSITSLPPVNKKNVMADKIPATREQLVKSDLLIPMLTVGGVGVLILIGAGIVVLRSRKSV